MKLFMNPNVNPTSDLSNSGSSNMEDHGYQLVKDWHDGCTPGDDGCGFMNCPRFCENTDRATCFGAYVDADAAVSEDTTSDTFDESSGSTYDGQSVSKYLTQMPICVTDMEYDA